MKEKQRNARCGGPALYVAGKKAAVAGVPPYLACKHMRLFPQAGGLGEVFSSPVRAYNGVAAHDT